jgi:hypothetical protein
MIERLPTPPYGHPCLVGFFIRREPPNKTAAPRRGFSSYFYSMLILNSQLSAWCAVLTHTTWRKPPGRCVAVLSFSYSGVPPE